MWTWMPYVCLGLGIAIGLNKLPERFLKALESLINLALIVLLLTVGMNLGGSKSILSSLGSIGLNCLIISFCAMACSVICTVIVEKLLLPLDEISKKTLLTGIDRDREITPEKGSISPLIWIMPLTIIIGTIAGYLVSYDHMESLLDYLLTGALVLIYICAGITMGANRSVFRYLKAVGFKVIFLSCAILFGSIIGGSISGFLLKLPPHVSVISASGMSFYSLTGAFMIQMYGAEMGTYGFIVNMIREFSTFLLLPLLARISKGSPIAVGGAAAMDTALVPITRAIGSELGLVTLITGTILTITIPLLLPLLHSILI
ncbi:MAG: lysine exporter LysO family protein [Firmicutes bacterium]|nr:lysine exporter LysO family protein [Bacillota bacterium]